PVATQPDPDGAAAPRELHEEVRTALAPHGIERFPPLQRRALDVFVRVEDALARDDVREAARLLDEFWRAHPPGTGTWARFPSRTADLNFGSPPAYYALRMLADVVAWRQQRAAGERAARAPQPIVLTVVLVGRAVGIEPSRAAELAAGTGREVDRTLHGDLLADDHRVIHQSLALFAAYVEAITAGRAPLRVEIVHLPRLRVRVEVRDGARRHAGLAPGALAQVFDALPDAARTRTDWWWVLYPSCVPDRHPDFARTEFITGGMAVGPDGGSPCFLIDDLWLVRKPPHLGQGPYSDLERRAYLPQWLQHEFFHHLFRTWREFELEKDSHQWFDRKRWPEDFTGLLEPDYYFEALHKRLLPRAQPPLHVALRYAPPPRAVVAKLQPRARAGSYLRTPRENDWHAGRIEDTGTRLDDGRAVLRWRNEAGVSWPLYFARGSASLETGRG